MRHTIWLLLGLILVSAPHVTAADKATSGKFITEPPTLRALGFEWYLAEDDNGNARVMVQYRRAGASEWSDALPLLRIGGEKVFRSKEYLEYWTPHMFAGSIFDLEEDAAYECRLEMIDPDGVSGQAVHTVTLRTRGVPREYSGGQVRHVYPPGYDGPREEPSFTGLKEAYYGPGGGDWNVLREKPVKPGDIILVHAGLYKADYLDYVNPYNIPFHGTYVLTVDGTGEKPIVIKAAGDGEVIFDGNGAYRLFDVMAADYNYIDGITIRNTDIGVYGGLKDVLGCSGLVVRNCRLENVGIGIFTQYAGSKNWYIADNVIIGKDDRYRIIGWGRGGGLYGSTPVESYLGIKVYGQGHVICHNYVAFFHDGICVCTHGPPEEKQENKSVAIDIYNNDVFVMNDDFIETDGGTHNIRVMRNRGFNAAQHGLSAQPVFGGPSYFIRNIVYNVPKGSALKYGGANPAGVVVYHNTFIAENSNLRGNSNVHYRNNLFMGTNHSQRAVLQTLTYTSYTSLDYNGYRPNNNGRAQFQWIAPDAGKLRDYSLQERSWQTYETLKEFQDATGQELNGRIVDYDIFQKVTPPNPDYPMAVYDSREYDFRLRPGSDAVDAGCRLPNINDSYNGNAPDLGALERGQPVPHYGPRTGRKAGMDY